MNNRICTRCIMDSSDPNIVFNNQGVCNHCFEFEKNFKKFGFDPNKSPIKLKQIIEKIKQEGKNRQYDCILGVSGGVDSSYLLHLAVSYGLRVLAIHVDAGWNTEVAVNNIKLLCEKLNVDLHTIVIDWNTIKELQRAYMYSGLPNLDIPQDHVFIAAVYEYSRRYRIKYILNGSNIATEGILPKSWGYSNNDFVSIKAIFNKFKRFKNTNLKKYPHYGLIKYLFFVSKLKKINMLNYIAYTKKEAISTLHNIYGWKYYGGKHFESRFTRFFQSYYLPKKFGYDKRRAHISSLIVNGEISRENALKEISDLSFYSEKQMIEDRSYILKKLEIPLKDWEEVIMNGPKRTEDDYPNNKKHLAIIKKISTYLSRFIKKER